MKKIVWALLLSLASIQWVYADEQTLPRAEAEVIKEEPKELLLPFYSEVIGFRNSLGNNNYNNQIQLRLYQPLDFGGGWIMQNRIDTAMVSNSGPKTPYDGSYFLPGNTRYTGSITTPQVAQDLKLQAGTRIYFPVGSVNPMYSTAQWEAGPQIGASWTPKNMGPLAAFNPMMRYMMGWNHIPSNIKDIRGLEMYPTMIFKITDTWRFHMWDENGFTINTNTGRWYTPVDAMVVHDFNKTVSMKLGGTYNMDQNLTGNTIWSGYAAFLYRF